MIETRDKTIDGHTISVTQFPGRIGFKYKLRLLKLMAPFAKSFNTENTEFNLLDMKIDAILLSNLANGLMEVLDPEDNMDLILGLLASTRYDNKEITPVVFDMEFAGDFLIVYKILVFVLEVNYGSFLGPAGIGGLTQGPQKAETSLGS